MNRRSFLRTLATGASAALVSTLVSCSSQAKRPNILFIAVDDLRPQLGCFGIDQIHSPNIDKLASVSFQAENAYCNVPVCGASRASLLTGVRPTFDRFRTFATWADKDLPGNVSLPEYFRNNGYYTVSNGKVFHHETDGEGSWSEKDWRPGGKNWRDYVTPESLAIADQNQSGSGPAFEMADVEDNAYFDGQTAERTMNDLERLSKLDQPFFLAAGFLKPHLPFNAPKKYWDMYNREEINMADNPFPPANAPDAALHNWGELRDYTNIPDEGPLTDEMARTLVHGYYACVSFTDAQVGKVLNKLDELGLADNTIVVLWGDHGWNLREHGLWCKHCNFNTSLRAPLLVHVPGMTDKGVKSKRLVEFVDIYPTLCELSGLPIPDYTEGSSMVPLIKNPERTWKQGVFSRFHNGETITTERYSYTEWREKDGQLYARMLYDHTADPKENVNIAEEPENAQLVEKLAARLKAGWKSELPG